MFKIILFPLTLVWKIIRIFFSVGFRILGALVGIVNRVFGIVKGILYGALGGFGKVGWKSRK